MGDEGLTFVVRTDRAACPAVNQDCDDGPTPRAAMTQQQNSSGTDPVRRAGVGSRVIRRGLFIALIFLAAAMPAQAIDSVTGTASSLVGAPVTVACEDLSEQEWWGAAEVGVPHIELDLEVCALLAATPRLYRGRYLGPSSGASVLTLAHEAAHVRGVTDEREADCFAIANLRRAAVGLGYHARQLPALRAQALRASVCQ